MSLDKITLVVGFDQKEAVVYHTFCQSVLENSSVPVSFIPLSKKSLYFYRENHTDGSNLFTYSRFLTPHICNFEGFAVYADGDMICNVDIAELLNLFDSKTAVQVVKHDYKTKRGVKYFDQINPNYPRKNWSSFIIFNCQHPSNKVLTPDFIESHDGAFLHRLSWLKDFEIGELSLDWNYLALEYPSNRKAKLIHYTLGSPCFSEFKDSDLSDFWWKAHRKSQQGLS